MPTLYKSGIKILPGAKIILQLLIIHSSKFAGEKVLIFFEIHIMAKRKEYNIYKSSNISVN